ncbi:hypothetical protein AS156_26040 [Bradyrhizobium macuxiense]|uniref:Uncharacterized protein n=1 Tax=Bradyrhizobium macuxiense TaxID=1755647 RepID=A0A109K517_9BRAD|nr:hypothetical protein [Bradyrhizobium macuxiense]KWV60888.1 hypothetical protein AS156_26040 [Bradyrhizobium macuxiense]
MIMRSFAAYILDPDGRIANRIDLLCLDEAVAKERAEALADKHQIELWAGDRLVGEFKPAKWPRSHA